jgi:hypothetical protein
VHATASTRMCAYVLTKRDCTDPIVGEMCQTKIRFIVRYVKLLLYIRYITYIYIYICYIYIYIYICERSRSCALAYMCMDMYACMHPSFARLV